MRFSTKASLLIACAAALAGCAPSDPPSVLPEQARANFEQRWNDLAREAERLKDRWDPAWLEGVKAKAVELQASLADFKIPEEERRRREHQLRELLDSLRAAEAVAKAKEGLSGLSQRAEPALADATGRLRRALQALQTGEPAEGPRPFP